jgi:hypothetical protein
MRALLQIWELHPCSCVSWDFPDGRTSVLLLESSWMRWRCHPIIRKILLQSAGMALPSSMAHVQGYAAIIGAADVPSVSGLKSHWVPLTAILSWLQGEIIIAIPTRHEKIFRAHRDHRVCFMQNVALLYLFVIKIMTRSCKPPQRAPSK